MLVEKKSRNLKITPQKVIYTVTYKPYNGQYYINHVRGDLFFQDKEKETTVRNFPIAYLVRDGYLQNRHEPSKPLCP